MQLPVHALPDSPQQRQRDRARLLRAFNVSLASVLLLCVLHVLQPRLPLDLLAVVPGRVFGLIGVFSAPLLHGDWAHLAMNAIGILMLGTLAGTVYPRATLRALPLLWLGSGLAAWALGDVGSRHLGASGVTHGLMFLVFVLGLLRRDRAAIAAAMLAFLFFGGMLLTIFPQEAGVSWQSHLGGAVGGLIAALLLRRVDPQPPRKRYSWEDEDDAPPADGNDAGTYEPPRPQDVPVLWQRPSSTQGNVVRFPLDRRRSP